MPTSMPTSIRSRQRICCLYSDGFAEFGDLVVPELQRRGRMPTHYAGQTLRERHFGVGHARLNSQHVAHRSLPPWKQKSTSKA